MTNFVVLTKEEKLRHEKKVAMDKRALLLIFLGLALACAAPIVILLTSIPATPQPILSQADLDTQMSERALSQLIGQVSEE